MQVCVTESLLSAVEANQDSGSCGVLDSAGYAGGVNLECWGWMLLLCCSCPSAGFMMFWLGYGKSSWRGTGCLLFRSIVGQLELARLELGRYIAYKSGMASISVDT